VANAACFETAPQVVKQKIIAFIGYFVKQGRYRFGEIPFIMVRKMID
jgi:hypothetical protein